MKKLLLVIALALMSPALAFAQSPPSYRAGTGKDLLGASARYTEQPLFFSTALTGTTGGSYVVGRSGLIGRVTLNGAFSVQITSTTATPLGAMPYPAKLTYVIEENGDDTGACQPSVTTPVDARGGITIVGTAVDGSDLIYYDSTVTEAAETTDVVFATVRRISFRGCQGNLDASDFAFVTTSNRVGFTGGLIAKDDIGVCLLNRSVISSEPRCALPTSCSTRSLAGDPRRDFVDPTSCTWPGTSIVLDDDILLLRYWVTPR